MSDQIVAAPRRGKSIGAVLLGLLAVFVLSLGTDMIMYGAGVFEPPGTLMPDSMFGLMTAYRLVYGVVGGYVTARYAPHAPMKHAIVLGVIGTLLSLAGALGTWDKGPEFGPKWYALALVVTALPCCWLGAKLYRPRVA